MAIGEPGAVTSEPALCGSLAPTSVKRTLRVLVSDPAPVDPAATAALLESAGYQAEVVSRTALVKAAREKRPDVILLGAPTHVDELRHFPSTARCGIVAIGERASDVSALGGADAFVGLPLDAHDLIDAVEGLRPPRRRTVDFRIRLHRAWGQEVNATALNLSETGILVRSEQAVDVGESMELEAFVRRGDFILSCLVARHAMEHGPTHLGLRFAHPRSVVRHAMRAFGI